MRILVTGGAGYIGSILVESLLSEGHEVAVVDNFLYRQWSLAHLGHHAGLSLHRGDVRDLRMLRPLLREADLIIPLAGIVGAPACARDPLAAASVNHDAPLKMLRELSAAQAVLMPTTNSAYGTTPPGTCATEESVLQPLSDYAKQKVEVEAALMERENSVSFRLATVFGLSPRMRLDLLVNDFTYRAVNDGFLFLYEGHFRRNYLHVRDVAQVFLHGISHFEQLRGQVFNAGLSGANLTKKELCARIQRLLPELQVAEALTGSDPDRRDYEISNDKLEGTGWRPRVDLDSGLRELIKGYAMLGGHVLSNVW